MKLVEFVKALKLLGLPVAFSHFESDAANPPPKPPFITYFTPATDNRFADNSVYIGVDRIDIELYTVKKDLEAEAKIEQFLKDQKLPYNARQVWIEREKVFQKTYETRLI